MIIEHFIDGDSVIGYYYAKLVEGLLVTELDITENIQGKKAWLKFLASQSKLDVYVSPTNISFIKNHVEFFGNFGKIKVYKYVRR